MARKKKKGNRSKTKGSRKAKRLQRKRRAKALKRKKALARAHSKPRSTEADCSPPTRSGVPAASWLPTHHELLHPAVLSAAGPQPPPLETLPGPGPAVLATQFGDRGIALYRRHESGVCVLVSPLELPYDTEVSWFGGPSTVRDVLPGRVSWHTEPVWQKDALKGAVVVHDLVEEEWGLVWAPIVPVTIEQEEEDGRWHVDAGEGLAEGQLEPEDIDWSSGSDGTHSYAVATFLSHGASTLWARVQRVRESTEEPVEGHYESEPPALVEAIKGPSPRYKRAAMDALVANREAVIPGLLAILDEILHSRAGGEERQDLGFAGLYAMVLLAHFRCTDAHDRLVALGRLPTDSFEEMLGGFLTEGFDSALLMTCGGNTSKIRQLVQDRAADEYLRSQAADALAGAVVLGYADRGETLTFLAKLLSPEEAPNGSYLWSGVGSAMLNLYPVEYEDRLEVACYEYLIEPMSFDAEFVRETIAEGPAHAAQDLRCIRDLGRRDVHSWMEWWACFDS